ncbi:UNKNOWN [Stylonychia lemnae]|uniref:Uncharacterized protein n=1 Tax=Stylonychia lemnae TaxID=5949 RepID=A0A078A6T5_STYLE|nr:UNKNOWN [Stylonychia lemnae]|eukprot:CDW77929.1 UNKNOWN [Stylonychia lemnae]
MLFSLFFVLFFFQIRAGYHQFSKTWVIREGKQMQMDVDLISQGDTVLTYDPEAKQFKWERLLIKQRRFKLMDLTKKIEALEFTVNLTNETTATLQVNTDQYVRVVVDGIAYHFPASEVDIGDRIYLVNANQSNDDPQKITNNLVTIDNIQTSLEKDIRYYDMYTASGNIVINNLACVCEIDFDGTDYYMMIVDFIEEHFDAKLPQIISDISYFFGLSDWIRQILKNQF